ncbi:MAG: AlbA family DNA-binding domain-containing protein [Chloroflexota bacterium]
MKEPWEWEESDIQSMIQNLVKESINLDYKGSPSLDPKDEAKKNEISKDISSFANSSGGVVLYGVVEANHIPKNIDSAYDPVVVTREWLEQIINSRIQRRIDGVRINQIELHATQPGKVIYAVSVPQSNSGPHMAADHKYYKRFNFQSVPMEDYEVRDVARRGLAPDLRLRLSFNGEPNCEVSFPGSAQFSTPAVLTGTLVNLSPAPAENLVLFLHIDSRLKTQFPSQAPDLVGSVSESTFQVGGQEVPVKSYRFALSAKDHMPVWEGLEFTFPVGIPSLVFPQTQQLRYVVGWEIHSPGMTPKKGTYDLIWGGWMTETVRITEVQTPDYRLWGYS